MSDKLGALQMIADELSGITGYLKRIADALEKAPVNIVKDIEEEFGGGPIDTQPQDYAADVEFVNLDYKEVDGKKAYIVFHPLNPKLYAWTPKSQSTVSNGKCTPPDWKRTELADPGKWEVDTYDGGN